MGVKLVDWWTLIHFLFGVMATMAICPQHPGTSILLGNIAHAYLESVEKHYRKGVQVESTRNQVGDLMAFLLGSLVGVYLTPFTIKHPTVRWIMLIFIVIAVIQEWGRETWPGKWPIDAANSPFGWFGTVTALVDDKKK